MQPDIRKIVTYDEEVLVEGFRKTETPWRMFAVAAIVRNPWAGRYVENLKPEIQAYGPILGEPSKEPVTVIVYVAVSSG